MKITIEAIEQVKIKHYITVEVDDEDQLEELMYSIPDDEQESVEYVINAIEEFGVEIISQEKSIEGYYTNIDGCNDSLERIEIQAEIIQDLKRKDTMYYKDAGYDSWFNFFSDAEIGRPLYEKVLHEEFTEEIMEKLWRDSHK